MSQCQFILEVDYNKGIFERRQCKGRAIKDREFCSVHDPDSQRLRRENKRKKDQARRDAYAAGQRKVARKDAVRRENCQPLLNALTNLLTQLEPLHKDQAADGGNPLRCPLPKEGEAIYAEIRASSWLVDKVKRELDQ